MPPKKTAEDWAKRTAALKKKLADKGDKLDAPAQRTLRKKIRRSQRRRRVLVAVAAKRASAGKDKEKKEA